MIIWDLVYDLFESHKEVMLHSSLSAVNVTDKQDPSLVIDISRLYELFLFHGYTALGLFFKATHFIAEAFLDKELDPYERVYKVWWAKTFFSTWGANASYKGQHITDQTFKDLICACDGMILYIMLLIKKYPDSVLTTELLGSDHNEQLFAFIRTSYAGGRSRNLDAATCAVSLVFLMIDLSLLTHKDGHLCTPQFLLLRSLPFLSKTPLNRILLCGKERW